MLMYLYFEVKVCGKEGKVVEGVGNDRGSGDEMIAGLNRAIERDLY